MKEIGEYYIEKIDDPEVSSAGRISTVIPSTGDCKIEDNNSIIIKDIRIELTDGDRLPCYESYHRTDDYTCDLKFFIYDTPSRESKNKFKGYNLSILECNQIDEEFNNLYEFEKLLIEYYDKRSFSKAIPPEYYNDKRTISIYKDYFSRTKVMIDILCLDINPSSDIDVNEQFDYNNINIKDWVINNLNNSKSTNDYKLNEIQNEIREYFRTLNDNIKSFETYIYDNYPKYDNFGDIFSIQFLKSTQYEDKIVEILHEYSWRWTTKKWMKDSSEFIEKYLNENYDFGVYLY